ncbi:T9SS type A sorting domain-containing protein [Kordia sp. YSTF-M3]|uniref:T9SS type A sorting domain-containing protein n=1 Tax=Kordia aestuariivivens TaxID=2759037 RepID=A0ABR7Q4N7_9FLAO|nr:T9SS type A sorting domain-containing protein [Kordia aestuariivivens]MBC8753351.1 T9SS type A sorting domain-containing protein [Kordia aestuariivivens]
MKNKITIVAFLFCITINAQINFDNEIFLLDESHVSNDATDLIMVDLDNDTDKDLVVASYYDDSIIWYENVNGDYRYHERKVISNQIDIPTSLKHADVNNDGFEDIIVSSASEDRIVWFRNLGNGLFSSEILLAGGINGPLDVAPVDIDGDGDIDIFTGGYDNELIFIENLGNATFNTPVVVYSSSYDVKTIKTHDLDNDGVLDVISAHSNGTVYWSKNMGSNTFGSRQYIAGSSNSGNSIAFLDVNEDGFLDAITVRDYSTDELRFTLNQNGTSFDSSNPVTIDAAAEDAREIQIKDIDNDGKKDIVVSFWTNDNISWYKNLGEVPANTNDFGSKQLLVANIANPRSFSIEDINNDGNQDIISTSYAPYGETDFIYKVSLFESQVSGNSYDETIINYFYNVLNDVKASDLNNDGNQDMIIASDAILWIENYGNEKFSSYKTISTIDNDNRFEDVEIADMNSDGFNDIVGLRATGIEIFNNQGDETFSTVVIPYSYLLRDLEVKDVDGDGIKDIILTIREGNNYKVGWIKNNGDDTYGNVTIIIDNTYGMQPNKITSGDIDNDGDYDIVISSFNYSRIQLLRNDGTGVFSFEPIISSSTTNGIVLGDVDNDGYLDIISGGFKSGNKVIFWIKNNAGTFAATRTDIDTTVGASEIDFVDLDNNGYKDIVCVYHAPSAYGNNETIFYYLNDGTSFGNKVLIDATGNAGSLDRDITLVDLNNDNKLDIVTSFYFSRMLAYYINTSILSVEEFGNDASQNFKVFPVPFSNKLSWKGAQEYLMKTISVYDMLGNNIYNSSNFSNNQIDLSSLEKGVYIITFETSNSLKFTKKVIKD